LLGKALPNPHGISAKIHGKITMLGGQTVIVSDGLGPTGNILGSA